MPISFQFIAFVLVCKVSIQAGSPGHLGMQLTNFFLLETMEVMLTKTGV